MIKSHTLFTSAGLCLALAAVLWGQSALAAPINLGSYQQYLRPNQRQYVPSYQWDDGRLNTPAGWTTYDNSGDFNGDGLTDLVVALDNTTVDGVERVGTIKLITGDADLAEINLSAATVLATNTQPDNQYYYQNRLYYIGDINADGFDDVYYDKIAANNVIGTVMLGNAAGAGSQAVTVVANFENDNYLTHYLQPGDFNGDGQLDLVLGKHQEDAIAIMFGPISSSTIDFTVDADVRISQGDDAYPTFIANAKSVADVDGDDLDDLLVSNYQPELGIIQEGIMTGSTISTATATLNFADTVMQLDDVIDTIGDVNGDGYADLLATNTADYPDYSVAVILGSASLVTTASVSADAVTQIGPFIDGNVNLHIADLNADGIGDLLITENECYVGNRYQCNRTYLFYGQTSWPAKLAPADADLRWVGAGVPAAKLSAGDMDDDGSLDLVLSAPTFGKGKKPRLYILSTSDKDGDQYSNFTGDCDDSAITSYPGAEDDDGDGVDDDCDGTRDDDYDFSYANKGAVTVVTAEPFFQLVINYETGSSQRLHLKDDWRVGRVKAKLLKDTDQLIAVLENNRGEDIASNTIDSVKTYDPYTGNKLDGDDTLTNGLAYSDSLAQGIVHGAQVIIAASQDSSDISDELILYTVANNGTLTLSDHLDDVRHARKVRLRNTNEVTLGNVLQYTINENFEFEVGN